MHTLVCKLLNDSFRFSSPDFDVKGLKQVAASREDLEIFWEDDGEEIFGYVYANDPEQKEIAYMIYFVKKENDL